MKSLKLFLCALLSFIFFSCNLGAYWFVTDENVEDRATSLKELDTPNTGTNAKYSIVIITDIHFGSSRAKRKDDKFIEWFSAQVKNPDETLRPRFMICLGDSLDGGHQSEADKYNEFCNTLKTIAQEAGLTDFKTYTILGNHDLYNDGYKVWKKNIFPYTSFYHFTTSASGAGKGFSWYFIDSANGTLGKPQLEALEKAVKKDSLTKIVLSHYPIYCDGRTLLSIHNTIEKNRLISLFAANDVRVIFEGHAHVGGEYDSKKFQEHLLKSYMQYYSYSLVTLDEDERTVIHPEYTFD